MSSRHNKVHEKVYDDRPRPSKGSRTRSPDSPPVRKRDDKKHRNALNTGLNDYFIDGEGIHRDVLQRNICFMLGHEATSKPAEYNKVQGYMITAVRPFTMEQLDDLVEISSKFTKENARYRQEQASKYKDKRDVPTLRYDQSETSQKYVPRTQDLRPSYPDEQQFQSGPYTNPGTRDPYGGGQPSYISSSNAAYQNPGSYSPGPQMTSGPPYQAPLHSSSRPIMNEPPLGYGRPEHPLDRDPYLQGSQYGPTSSREYGMDTRDPRYAPPMDVGRGNRPQQPLYAQPSFNSPDVIMQDSYDPGYGPMDLDPGRQPQRVASGYQPPGMRMPVGAYDERIPPDQGPYKMSYPKEERRHRDEYDRRRH